jgi:hypothetical protein
MQIIVMSALIVVLPLAIMGFVAMWREHQYKKETRPTEPTTA